MAPLFDEVVMREQSMKYIGVRQVVLKARKRLGIPRFDGFNPDLHEECHSLCSTQHEIAWTAAEADETETEPDYTETEDYTEKEDYTETEENEEENKEEVVDKIDLDQGKVAGITAVEQDDDVDEVRYRESIDLRLKTKLEPSSPGFRGVVRTASEVDEDDAAEESTGVIGENEEKEEEPTQQLQPLVDGFRTSATHVLNFEFEQGRRLSVVEPSKEHEEDERKQEMSAEQPCLEDSLHPLSGFDMNYDLRVQQQICRHYLKAMSAHNEVEEIPLEEDEVSHEEVEIVVEDGDDCSCEEVEIEVEDGVARGGELDSLLQKSTPQHMVAENGAIVVEDGDDCSYEEVDIRTCGELDSFLQKSAPQHIVAENGEIVVVDGNDRSYEEVETEDEDGVPNCGELDSFLHKSAPQHIVAENEEHDAVYEEVKVSTTSRSGSFIRPRLRRERTAVFKGVRVKPEFKEVTDEPLGSPIRTQLKVTTMGQSTSHYQQQPQGTDKQQPVVPSLQETDVSVVPKQAAAVSSFQDGQVASAPSLQEKNTEDHPGEAAMLEFCKLVNNQSSGERTAETEIVTDNSDSLIFRYVAVSGRQPSDSSENSFWPLTNKDKKSDASKKDKKSHSSNKKSKSCSRHHEACPFSKKDKTSTKEKPDNNNKKHERGRKHHSATVSDQAMGETTDETKPTDEKKNDKFGNRASSKSLEAPKEEDTGKSTVKTESAKSLKDTEGCNQYLAVKKENKSLKDKKTSKVSLTKEESTKSLKVTYARSKILTKKGSSKSLKATAEGCTECLTKTGSSKSLKVKPEDGGESLVKKGSSKSSKEKAEGRSESLTKKGSSKLLKEVAEDCSEPLVKKGSSCSPKDSEAAMTKRNSKAIKEKEDNIKSSKEEQSNKSHNQPSKQSTKSLKHSKHEHSTKKETSTKKVEPSGRNSKKELVDTMT